MGNFFKGIGKGLLNIVTIPVWAIGLALSAIAGIGVFFWEVLKKLEKLVTGKSLTNLLPEDIQAKEMLDVKPKKEEKDDSVEIGQAEIAEPYASVKEIERPTVNRISVDEEVDFIIDDSTIDVKIPKEDITPEFEQIPLDNGNDLPKIENDIHDKVEEKVEEVKEEEIPFVPETPIEETKVVEEKPKKKTTKKSTKKDNK